MDRDVRHIKSEFSGLLDYPRASSRAGYLFGIEVRQDFRDGFSLFPVKMNQDILYPSRWRAAGARIAFNVSGRPLYTSCVFSITPPRPHPTIPSYHIPPEPPGSRAPHTVAKLSGPAQMRSFFPQKPSANTIRKAAPQMPPWMPKLVLAPSTVAHSTWK